MSDILNDIRKNSRDTNFNQATIDVYDEISKVDPISGINNMFKSIVQSRKCTLDEINLMINFGANPIIDDCLFLNICRK